MQGFLLDSKGDVVIENNAVPLISDYELIAQTVKQVMMTNLGEWEYNKEEGIDRDIIFTRNPDMQAVEDCIRSALYQVDESLELASFESELDAHRVLHIKFTAVNGDEEEAAVNVEFDL